MLHFKVSKTDTARSLSATAELLVTITALKDRETVCNNGKQRATSSIIIIIDVLLLLVPSEQSSMESMPIISTVYRNRTLDTVTFGSLLA